MTERDDLLRRIEELEGWQAAAVMVLRWFSDPVASLRIVREQAAALVEEAK